MNVVCRADSQHLTVITEDHVKECTVPGASDDAGPGLGCSRRERGAHETHSSNGEPDTMSHDQYSLMLTLPAVRLHFVSRIQDRGRQRTERYASSKSGSVPRYCRADADEDQQAKSLCQSDRLEPGGLNVERVRALHPGDGCPICADPEPRRRFCSLEEHYRSLPSWGQVKVAAEPQRLDTSLRV